MREPLTSIPLILTTLASVLATALALRRLRTPQTDRPSAWPMHLLLGAIALACAAVFGFRVFFVHQAWQPVQAHVDGLLLIAALLAPAIVYIQSKPKLFGLSVFLLPLLTLILAWGVCASLWTYRPFKLNTFEPAALVFHLATIYLGLLCCAIGAGAGAMYLFVQGRLKAKAGLANVKPMASLETLETLIIRSATLGFVLLTIAMVSGLVIATQDQYASSLGRAWWASPKVWLASAAWALYALLINVKHTSTFRGRRAAWLAIAGLVLVLATYGVVEVIDRASINQQPTTAVGAEGGG